MKPTPGTVDVSFAPAGRRGPFPTGTTVLDAARALGVDLDSVCGGRGICGRCQIEIGSRPGVSAEPTRLSEPTTTEAGYSGRRPLVEGRRLGCAARIEADVVVVVPESSQVHRQVVSKEVVGIDAPVDPVIALRYVEVAAPGMQASIGDLQRVEVALAEEWGLNDLRFDHSVLRALQPALERGNRGITLAVRSGHDVIAVWPGLRDRAHGVAFDVGSTTLAGHLCDLFTGEVLASAGAMNPQIGYGEDLMSRVSYVMMNPGGEHQLTSVVRRAMAQMIGDLCTEAGVDPGDVLEVSLVGNPIMHHLAFGMDPRPLGSAPFALATTDSVTVPASELELGVHPGARVYAPPCIAGHVGADAAAMVLAEAPHHGTAITLLVDVGTNAEIVLGNKDRLLAASSPTGPAFEGAQVSSGQRAAPGAIERVRIDRESLEPRIRLIGSRYWSDESRFARAVARTGVTGICGSGIIEVIAELFLAGVISVDGTIRPRPSSRVVANGRTFSYRLWDDPVIEVTQNDVRAIQLAKAALQAGCRLLMDHMGIEEPDEIRLTGAFGSHIDPVYATVLGLLPDCDLDRVHSVGNSAGRGSLMALLSVGSRRDVEEVTATIEKIETAIEPSFQAHFVAAMAFPHTSLPYPHLSKRMTLPTPAATDQRRRRRKRHTSAGEPAQSSFGVDGS
jgi:uncharacterized 2Fe-2S/4Fe-4S cluster protein (DUF4445 family)